MKNKNKFETEYIVLKYHLTRGLTFRDCINFENQYAGGPA